MEKIQVTIEKVHYEPYPIKDMITAWECDANGVDFLISLKEQTQELRKLFDTKQDWAYEVAHANIYINGEKASGDNWDCMPSWTEIDFFIEALEAEIEEEIAEYAVFGPKWETVEFFDPTDF